MPSAGIMGLVDGARTAVVTPVPSAAEAEGAAVLSGLLPRTPLNFLLNAALPAVDCVVLSAICHPPKIMTAYACA